MLAFSLAVITFFTCTEARIRGACWTEKGIQGQCTELVLCHKVMRNGLSVTHDPCMRGYPVGVCCPLLYIRQPQAPIALPQFSIPQFSYPQFSYPQFSYPQFPFPQMVLPIYTPYTGIHRPEKRPNNKPVPFTEKPVRFTEKPAPSTEKLVLSTEKPERTPVRESRELLPENTCGYDQNGRQFIFGGDQTDVVDHPWLAVLQYYVSHSQTRVFRCAGSLISSRYILTAAHCINSKEMRVEKIKLIAVTLGEWDMTRKLDCSPSNGTICNEAIDVDIEDVVIHPRFKPPENLHPFDIGLIRMSRDVKFTMFIRPICLPFEVPPLQTDDLLTAVGWGRTTNEKGSESPIKLSVDLGVSDFNLCSELYKWYAKASLRQTQFCAGAAEKDTCQADSGGPILQHATIMGQKRWVIRGIITGGFASCGFDKRPGIYIDVSKFVPWILKNIRS